MPLKILKKKTQKEKVTEHTHLIEFCQKYSKCVVVGINNVTSQQLHNIRAALRVGDSELLVGKKSVLRHACGDESLKGQEKITDYILRSIQAIKDRKENVAFIFTNADLLDIKKITEDHRKNAPARVGAISPIEVVVPAFNTGCPPDDTKFFQAIGLQTKIVKGTVEITQEKKVLEPGQKVDSSCSALLLKLKIFPFYYGLTLEYIYDDGEEYDASILAIEPEDFADTTESVVAQLTAISLGAGIPNELSWPHLVTNGFKDMLAVSLATDYSFDAFNGKQLKEDIASGKAVAAAPAAAAGGGNAAPVAAAAEPTESSEGGMGGLFD
jgi:large subunit ribosomal protein LP0